MIFSNFDNLKQEQYSSDIHIGTFNTNEDFLNLHTLKHTINTNNYVLFNYFTKNTSTLATLSLILGTPLKADFLQTDYNFREKILERILEKFEHEKKVFINTKENHEINLIIQNKQSIIKIVNSFLNCTHYFHLQDIKNTETKIKNFCSQLNLKDPFLNFKNNP